MATLPRYGGTTFQGQNIGYRYDSLQRLTSVIDPRTGATTITYKTGTTLQETVKTPATGSTAITTNTYDSLGRVTVTTDYYGNHVRYAYNARGQLQYQWGEACTPVEYVYDSTYSDRTQIKTYRNGSGWGNTTWAATTPGTADTTTWTYDAYTGLIYSKADNSGGTITFDYNVRQQVSKRTLARGVYTTYSYEDTSGYQTGELKQVSYSDGNTPTVEYHRDPRLSS